MAEQQQQEVVKEPVWALVEGKNGLERAKVGVIRMSPDVEPEIREKYQQHMIEMRDGKIKGENGKPPMVTFEHGEHVYGLTYFTDNDSFSVWRRKKGAGGGSAKKTFLRLKFFKTGGEQELNDWIASHPNNNYDILAHTFADFTTGVQQFILTEKEPVGMTQAQPQSSEKTEATKTA